MTPDRSFVELNCASTNRMRALAARLTDEELQQRVGEHWTVAIALAHLAFWDRRVMQILDNTEREGRLSLFEIDILVNDISLPLWANLPPDDVSVVVEALGEALAEARAGHRTSAAPAPPEAP